MQHKFGLYEGLADLQLKSRATVMANTPGVLDIRSCDLMLLGEPGMCVCVADNVLLKFSSWRDSQKPYP